MTDHDRAAARREITDALVRALERRHEVLDLIVGADDRFAAVNAITDLLDIPPAAAEAVMAMSFDQLTKEARQQIATELDNLNAQLSFTARERPASSGETLMLRPFSPESDRDIFAARTADVGAAGDGSGAPASDLDDEIGSAQTRFHNEDAVWLVAVEGQQKVGMVFGELAGGEVNVRIWIHPDHRKRGYGTAALRKSRSEMAAYFPAVPLVIRAPGAMPAVNGSIGPSAVPPVDD
ncbi:GNAT family N-acetyltransferase [Mycobacterium sp.]|jgi:GNAT superfamily N-acetyltransferase|uniref:GNAT family N-acetyltransferase n=1 Tax=Mycobacterium sp. TaxID=1785 RepID=UPI002D4D19B8|nr:GNAT family N-acetyltransferase [Mycobacterium sp.]HZA08429.1 GNAT family N-acetyltransferase [Mycobacterium sp.]